MAVVCISSKQSPTEDKFGGVIHGLLVGLLLVAPFWIIVVYACVR